MICHHSWVGYPVLYWGPFISFFFIFKHINESSFCVLKIKKNIKHYKANNNLKYTFYSNKSASTSIYFSFVEIIKANDDFLTHRTKWCHLYLSLLLKWFAFLWNVPAKSIRHFSILYFICSISIKSFKQCMYFSFLEVVYTMAVKVTLRGMFGHL